ncbi:hypothetical protein PAU_01742 [Photorhabdus asymbiotica]|uniref:Uncharacterized protein n=1 Tax=Photorhabdus asymbiotica subsp. asymbiotica (strain ATCC 43949 / 3105-77) TaxID=553480 RepID=C7BTH9_PHOAA|nr:hypothetical protein PAU_01742 [Photorhabdus asymbiotica]
MLLRGGGEEVVQVYPFISFLNVMLFIEMIFPTLVLWR